MIDGGAAPRVKNEEQVDCQKIQTEFQAINCNKRE
jgi:hypothetical protein